MITNKPPGSKNNFLRFLAVCLAGTTASQMMILPMLAEGTEAGTTIINEATGTYEDGEGTQLDTTSNEVTVTVAEVAGITSSPIGINDTNQGSVQEGDELIFEFLVTNTGNNPTDIHIPSASDLITEGLDRGNLSLEVEIDDSFIPVSELTDEDGNPDNLVKDVASDEEIVVRVTGNVTANQAGDAVSVTLGDTGANDNSPQTQNQRDSPDDANANEVRTEDPTKDDDTDDPINGEREASATQSIPLATAMQPLALATIEKVAADVDPGPNDNPSDDTITYELILNVADTSPNGNFTPTALAPTSINLDGTSTNRILVSDVIPENTELDSTPTAPEGWKVVYSTDETESTIPVEATDATATEWLEQQPDLGDVTRVGFIFDNDTADEGSDDIISTGTETSGFEFTVNTIGLDGTDGGNIENIAQVFGQTDGDPDDDIVYDESGDQNPNNFNDDKTPPDETGTDYDPNEDTGIPDANEDQVDENNDNQGTGPDGEVNVVTIGTPTVGDDILNGPDGEPDAVGPNNLNDDFTNVATTLNGADPDPTTITNTVGIPSTATEDVDKVTVEPVAPSVASEEAGDFFGLDSDIPDGTTVTLDDDPSETEGNTATYTYTEANGFQLDEGDPLELGTIAPGEEVEYGVTVDLPDGSEQLEDIGIPIITFSDSGDPGFGGIGENGDGTESTNNLTINRVYTGFIRLEKTSRILNSDGTVRNPDFGDNGFTENSQNVQPGQFIEYKVEYENISETAQGSGNVILEAQNFVIAEDGTIDNNDGGGIDGSGNNWGLDQDGDGALDTSHTQNTSASQGTVYYYNGPIDSDEDGFFEPTTDLGNNGDADTENQIGSVDPSDETTVTGYVNEVGAVPPGESGEFIFRRRVE